MNVEAPEASLIHSFLAAARRRLWAARALECGRDMLWQIGFLFLILSGIHLWSTSISISLLLFGVASLALLTLLRILLNRPTMAASAARADREFNGRALMTTALECLQEPVDTNDTAPGMVLEQARAAAVCWRPDISRLFKPPQAGTSALTMIPIFVAAVLLSFPGAEVDNDAAENVVQATGVAGGRNESSIADAGDVATIRRALADENLFDEKPTVDEQRDNESTNLTPYRGAGSDVVTRQLVLPEQSAAGKGVAGTSGESNELPGNALPNSRPATGDATASVQFQSREMIELQRTGAVVAAGEGRSATFGNTITPISTSPIEVLPALPPSNNSRRATLTSTQAAHASRYLAETGKAND